MKSDTFKETYSTQLDTVKELLEKKGRDAINFVEKLTIPCCITDRYGNFENINHAYCKMYGYTHDELIGQHFTMIVPEDSRAYLTEMHDLFMERKFELQSEFTVLNKKSELRTIMANAAYVIDAAMNPYKITFLVDITAKQNEVKLLQNTISNLEDNLSVQSTAQNILFHDMRKPLATILGLAEALGDPPFDEESLEYYRMIPNLAQKALHMVEAFEGIHRMEKGVFEPVRKKFNLLSLTKQLITYLQPDLSQKGLRITIDVEHEGKDLVVNAEQLYIEMMLENLLTNAIQASPASSEIKVNIKSEEKAVQLSVCNSGAVPTQIRSRFFEKYATAGKVRGTGLGTYIAKLIVDHHQGEIDFEVKEEQRTILRVTLPTYC